MRYASDTMSKEATTDAVFISDQLPKICRLTKREPFCYASLSKNVCVLLHVLHAVNCVNLLQSQVVTSLFFNLTELQHQMDWRKVNS